MSRFPRLQTGGLPGITEGELQNTASPSRGKAMRDNLLQKLRAPALVHQWEFWHDRQDRKKPDHTPDSATPSGGMGASAHAPAQAQLSPPGSAGSKSDDNYEDRLVKLHTIGDVKSFWQTFNNFDVDTLPLRDSIHLFHLGVKPVWEDPRNERGGSWTFRVPKENAKQFWQEVCLLAIGEKLQNAVESNRLHFRDDICGVSLSVRFSSTLITIWNRDAEHKEGVERILKTVLDALPSELTPREGSYYYKRHSEHAGFKGPQSTPAPAA